MLFIQDVIIKYANVNVLFPVHQREKVQIPSTMDFY